MENWGPFLAAVLGSAGIAALLTVGLTFTRRARLRRSIETAQHLLETTQSGPRVKAALQQSIDMDSLRIAATSMIGFGHWTRYIIVGAVTAVVVVASSSWLFEILGARALPMDDAVASVLRVGDSIVGYLLVIAVPIVVVVVESLIYIDREAFVHEVVLRDQPTFRTAQMRRWKRTFDKSFGPDWDKPKTEPSSRRWWQVRAPSAPTAP